LKTSLNRALFDRFPQVRIRFPLGPVQAILTQSWNFLKSDRFVTALDFNACNMTSFRTHRNPNVNLAKGISVICCAFACMLTAGCRQRAYTELYVENMAAEIRGLEDRVYEYDAAYQAQEIELDELRRTNEQLEGKLRDVKENAGGAADNSSRKFKGSGPKIQGRPEPYEVTPESISPRETYDAPSVLIPDSRPNSNPSASPEVLEKPPAVMRSPVAPPALKVPAAQDELLPNVEPLLPPANRTEKLGSEGEPRTMLKNRPKPNTSGFPSPESLVEQVVMPDNMVRSAQQPRLIMEPPPQSNSIPFPTSGSGGAPASNVPSLLPKAFQNLPANNPQGSLQRKQIRLPEGSSVQRASANEPVPSSESSQTSLEITDKKMIDIAFHPTLCRGHNFDEKPGDDGLYLVVTPLNSAGQVLNTSGTLSVIVEDESIGDGQGRIAAWEFTPAELKEMLTPIGASQGFHLSLPWQEVQPKSQKITVYLRYVLDDGRIHVNKRAIQLRKPGVGQSVWTPRQ